VTSPAEESWNRQQRRDLLGDARRLQHALVDTGCPRVTAAGLAMRDVAGEPTMLADAEHADRLRPAGVDHGMDLLAALAARDLFVLLAEAPTRPEERALDDRSAHPHPAPDLGVRQPLQLAKHEDLVVVVRQPAECAAQIVQLLAALERSVWGRAARDEGGSLALSVVIRIERHFLGPARAAELVDAGVLGDLVDPGLERDRPVGRAHTAQSRDENLLGYVLGAPVVADHPQHIRDDPPAVTRVELAERPVVAAPNRADEIIIAGPENWLSRAYRRNDRPTSRETCPTRNYEL